MFVLKNKFLSVLVFSCTFLFVLYITPGQATCTKQSCKLIVVGDMGIGEDSFNKGFERVQSHMLRERPDVVLYLGDYIYSDFACDKRTNNHSYMDDVKNKLVTPFLQNKAQVIFSRGDNDKISKLYMKRYPELANATMRCWTQISKMGQRLKKFDGARYAEGIIDDLPGVFIAVLDNEAFTERSADSYLWLKKPIRQAKKDGKWVIVIMHAPVITTAWYPNKCCKTLKPLHQMGVDLVFSGHQHSFERSHPLRLNGRATQPIISQKPKRNTKRTTHYKANNGVVYFVSGGGGALLRPFADQQELPGFLNSKKAPKHIRKAIAHRAIMNHYISIDLSPKQASLSTHRICTYGESRWKPDSKTIWPKASDMLECQGKPFGKSLFDHFTLKR